MWRIRLTVLLALSLFLAPLSVDAQQTYRQAHIRLVRLRDRSAVRGKGACRYCNRRIDLVPNLPAATVRRHIVIRRLLLSRKRHPEDWTRLVDSQKRVVCPGSGQPPKFRSSEDKPATASATEGGAEGTETHGQKEEAEQVEEDARAARLQEHPAEPRTGKGRPGTVSAIRREVRPTARPR